SQRIPLSRAGVYVALFFLSGVSSIISNLIYWAGPSFYFLYSFFNAGNAVEQARADGALNADMVRFSGFSSVSPAIYSWIRARYGIEGSLALARPWRFVLLASAVAAGLFGGFRSGLIGFAVTFSILFVLEGLHRTKYLFAVFATVLLSAVLLVPF